MSRRFTARLIEKRWLSSEHFLLRLVPEEKTPEPKPGQFYLLRPSDTYDPLLRRPFSIFRSSKGTIEFFIEKKGKGTTLLSELQNGERLDCMGPLGRGFPLNILSQDSVVVAGGMGIASVFSLLEHFKDLIFIYGARTKEQLFFLDELSSLKRLITVTEDGSHGKRGNTVDALKEVIEEERVTSVFACGPEGMNQSVSRLLKSHSIEGYISFEERMACGVGACLGCVKETPQGMKRVCTEGPVFSVKEL